MNVKALLRADQWVGVPLCFVLSAARAVFGRPAPDCSRPPRSILFVKLAEQGSTVLAYAALRRAVEAVGREQVYALVLEENRFILDLLGVIPKQNVITVRHKSFAGLVGGALSALKQLRALKLEAAIDLEFFSRGSAAATFLSGAKRRAGFHPFFGAGPYRGNLMTHRLLYNAHLHTEQTFLSMVEAALRPPGPLPTFDWAPPGETLALPLFAPSCDETAQVSELIRRETGGAPPLLLLNANASDLLPLRRWPGERYVELARRLLRQFPEGCVAFTGAPEEGPATGELVRQVADKRCVSLAGKTTLRQLLVLYTLSKVLVTNDSGPAHFAALTPIRVVTLFGPETPVLFGARTARNTILWAGLACSPCVNAYNNRQSCCTDNRCMKAISVDAVFAAVVRAYEQGTGTRAGASPHCSGPPAIRD